MEIFLKDMEPGYPAPLQAVEPFGNLTGWSPIPWANNQDMLEEGEDDGSDEESEGSEEESDEEEMEEDEEGN